VAVGTTIGVEVNMRLGRERSTLIMPQVQQDIGGRFQVQMGLGDVLPGNHAIGKLARQMETSDAARPFYRGSDHRRAA